MAADLIARRIYQMGILPATQMRRYYSLGKNVNDRDKDLDKIIKIEKSVFLFFRLLLNFQLRFIWYNWWSFWFGFIQGDYSTKHPFNFFNTCLLCLSRRKYNWTWLFFVSFTNLNLIKVWAMPLTPNSLLEIEIDQGTDLRFFINDRIPNFSTNFYIL